LLLLLLWLTCCRIGSVTAQLLWLAQNYQETHPAFDAYHSVESLTQAVNWIVSLGFVAAPLIGWVLDNYHPSTYIGITQIFALITAFLRLVPGHPSIQLATFFVYMLYRTFFYAAAATSTIYYYGIEKLGRIWGFALLFSGFFSLLQYPLNRMAETTYHGNYVQVNMLFLIATVVGFCYPFFLWREKIVNERTLLLNNK